MSSARAFLNGIIDYAGLFPPASLDMNDAVRAYADYRSGPDRDLLGRFVVPSNRLDEMAVEAEILLPRGKDPWRLSVVAGAALSSVRDAMLHFNCSHSPDSSSGHAICDAVEIRVQTRDEVTQAVNAFPDSFELFLEVPVTNSVEDLIAAIAGTRAAAKIRTGGVSADAIPSSADVLRFLRACSRHALRFKATAGLHHAVRGPYHLTYERDAPTAVMFGYLNVFLAAAFLEAGLSEGKLLDLLEETDASAFRFDDSGVSWRDNQISADVLERARSRAMSFGSCSFNEPVEEAALLGLTAAR